MSYQKLSTCIVVIHSNPGDEAFFMLSLKLGIPFQTLIINIYFCKLFEYLLFRVKQTASARKGIKMFAHCLGCISAFMISFSRTLCFVFFISPNKHNTECEVFATIRKCSIYFTRNKKKLSLLLHGHAYDNN